MSAYIYRIDEGLQFFALQSGIAERNANELRRADHEVHDIADGRYFILFCLKDNMHIVPILIVETLYESGAVVDCFQLQGYAVFGK